MYRFEGQNGASRADSTRHGNGMPSGVRPTINSGVAGIKDRLIHAFNYRFKIKPFAAIRLDETLVEQAKVGRTVDFFIAAFRVASDTLAKIISILQVAATLDGVWQRGTMEASRAGRLAKQVSLSLQKLRPQSLTAACPAVSDLKDDASPSGPAYRPPPDQ